VTTVSQTYSFETRSSEHGAGLDGVLRAVSYKYSGILNGIDTDEWDPATDALVTANYDADTLKDKQKNKRALAKEAGFAFSAKTPIIGAISRLVGQKGFQLLIPVLDRILHAGAQVAILGSGEPELEEALSRIAAQHSQCRVWIGFDNALAHRIYAGSDMLLMPSIYEPCGLNQMYALRYGTVPIVRLTGGLADTVIPFDGSNEQEATGFGFVAPHPVELYLATWVAMLNYKDGSAWKTLQLNGMQKDFSWERSAREYDRIYKLAADMH
jgi:starch synthase